MTMRRWQAAGVCVLLAGLVWLMYAQTIGFKFVNFDDNHYIYENPIISRGLDWERFLWVFTHVHASNWHPLTSLSHMLDCEIFGLKPAGHHMVNVLLHSLVAVSLFLVLWQMTGGFWQSAAVAAAFASHPLRVESVAWISERKDLLSGLFFMLTLAAYVRYARRPGSGSLLLVLMTFALGLMTKPMLVSLPLILLLLDYWPLKRWRVGSNSLDCRLHFPLHLVAEKLLMFALAGISCVATLVAQRDAVQSLDKVSLAARVGNAAMACVTYLGQMVWPVNLAVYYPFKAQGAVTLLVAVLLLTGLSVGAFMARRAHPYLSVGWLWYLIMLVPVIGIVQVGLQAHADRYTYLPQIGLYVALVWLAANWIGQNKWRKTAAGFMAVGIVSLLGVAAHRQASFWRDSVILWSHALECTPDSLSVRTNLGIAFLSENRVREASEQFHEVLRIDPAFAEAHYNLGKALLGEGNTVGAIDELQKVLDLQPGNLPAKISLAWLLATATPHSLRDGEKSAALATQVSELSGFGRNPRFLRVLAAAYAEAGRFSDAAGTAARALQLAREQPRSPIIDDLEHDLQLYRRGSAFNESR